jgi:hypothetical protein
LGSEPFGAIEGGAKGGPARCLMDVMKSREAASRTAS